MTRHRIAVVSDPPVLAGGSVAEDFAARFTEAAGQRHDVLAISVPAPRNGAAGRLRGFAPDAVFYVPAPPRRMASFVRARTLRRLAPRAAHGMIHLAPFGPIRRWRFAWRFFSPPFAWVGSYRSLLNLSTIAVRGDVLGPLLDTGKFRRVPEAERGEERRRWGIVTDAFVVLHLAPPSCFPPAPVVQAIAAGGEVVQVVGARKTGGARPPVPPGLRETAVAPADLYGIADCCVWSGTPGAGDVETPPGPLEALASGVPVLAGPAGGLPDFLSPGDDLYYWNSIGQLHGMLRSLRAKLPVRTRAVDEFDRGRVVGNLIHKLVG